MAINVNTVYQTVLYILNKEQRGYMTPDEFNHFAQQVQLEIFEKYTEDLNLQGRVPQTEIDYANRIKNTQEKLSHFKSTFAPQYVNTGDPTTSFFTTPSNLYRIGNVTFRDFMANPAAPSTFNFINDYIEVQPLDRHEFNLISRSKLTTPTRKFPCYLLESNNIFIKPLDINAGTTSEGNGSILVDYIRTPLPPVWGYYVGSQGQYIYATNYVPPGSNLIPSTGSVNFELDVSEQSEVIIRILQYAGIAIRDPQIVQIATQKVESDEIMEKQ